ncbi:D-amino-acid oxidase-like [Mytilus californianus]|uniref:D-amino-acid oxidase-like n=1 Tax=Mytilus californianus TaxID=6549 RepID=UPI0022461B6A|nr:D-amino-acid oxidase-like [Mytilus californianus]
MNRRKVCVIGAGVIGLSSAVRIQDKIPSIDITIIADTFSPYTTSDGSAGFWEPHLVNPDQSEELRKWGQETFDYLLDLVQSQEAGKLGAQLVSGYDFSIEHHDQDPFWKDQVIAYRRLEQKERRFHPKNKGGIFYSSIMIDVKSYLPWLMEKFKSRGGKVQFGTISSVNEISDKFDLIINCVGVRAYQLLNDQNVKPIRGQIIKVIAPWIKHFYVDFDGAEGTERYILPGRDYVILGGTGQEGNWSTDINQKDKNRIWESCVNLVPSLKNAQKIGDWVGLRPGRTKVRLELDEQRGSSGCMVIHNYGHSGAGVTLHWGCAGNVAELAHATLTTLSSRL